MLLCSGIVVTVADYKRVCVWLHVSCMPLYSSRRGQPFHLDTAHMSTYNMQL